MTQAWIPVRVACKRAVARDIVHMILEAEDGAALPAFDAGAHIDVELPGGIVRQYSLCGVPGAARRYELGILNDPQGRGGSRAIHDRVATGDALRISPPRNLFPLTPGEPALLFAGGIGITPILAMAEQLHRDGTPFELHYCVRSRDRAAFLDRIENAPYAAGLHLHSDDRPDSALRAAALLARPSLWARLYICGPGGFIDFVTRTAQDAGWPPERIHFERFAAAPAPATGERPFELQLADSGRIIPVRADQSAADALLEAGFDLPLSCEMGLCGTCVTPVEDGVPDHRDQHLTPEERAANRCFTPCCSRAHSPRLVIRL